MRCTTPPPRPCRPSSTAGRRGRAPSRVTRGIRTASSPCWPGSATAWWPTSRCHPLCPPAVCPDEAESSRDVLAELRGPSGRCGCAAGSPRFGRRDRPTLYVHHALLPHEPWIYLPSGRPVRPAGIDPIGAINRPNGFGDPDLTDHNQLRHLLQVGSVDREIGALVRHLRAGAPPAPRASDRGGRPRLRLRGRRAGPAQGHGVEHRPDRARSLLRQGAGAAARPDRATALVANFDVVPTVADVLGVRVPWTHESRSAFSEARDDVQGIRIPTRDFGDVIEISREELERRRARSGSSGRRSSAPGRRAACSWATRGPPPTASGHIPS